MKFPENVAVVAQNRNENRRIRDDSIPHNPMKRWMSSGSQVCASPQVGMKLVFCAEYLIRIVTPAYISLCMYLKAVI